MCERPKNVYLARRCLAAGFNSRIGDIPLPLRSPYLSANDLRLWTHLRRRVFVDRPRNTAELKTRHHQQTENMLHAVMEDFERCVEQCIEMTEDHLLETIFKS